MIDTQSRIDGQPRGEILTEVHIAGYLIAVALATLLVGGVKYLTGLFRGIVGVTIDMLVVDSDSQSVTLEELCALIPGDSYQCVFGTEIALGGLLGIRCPVVNLVSSEIRVDAQCSAGAVIVVLKGCGDYSTGDPLVCVIERTADSTGVGGVEVGQVGVDIGVPMTADVVTSFR